MDSTAVIGDQPGSSGNRPSQDDPLGLIGRQIGSYQIVSLLGKGGMAAVYKGQQKSLGRFVAIKVMPPTFTHDPDYLERFRREALAVGRLDHPSIVHVYDAGQDGVYPYIAMQLLEGGTLSERLRREGPMTPLTASTILTPIAAALDHAHRAGIVHRDIKPSNIMFTGDGRAILSDFGIARIVDAAGVTTTGTFVGTPAYVSPEQVQNKSVDARSDVYSLGIVLYEMLTGDVPFKGDPTAVLHAHVYTKPPDPGKLTPRVRQVVMRALAKDPNERYSAAGALASGLSLAAQREVDRKSTAAGLPQRVAELPRHIRIAGVVVTAALPLLLAVILVSRPAMPPPATASVGQGTTPSRSNVVAGSERETANPNASTSSNVSKDPGTLLWQSATPVIPQATAPAASPETSPISTSIPKAAGVPTAPSPVLADVTKTALPQQTNQATPMAPSSMQMTPTAGVDAPSPTVTASMSKACLDAYEPDDSAGQAQEGSIGADAQEHSSAPAGDEDWIKFPALPGYRYTLRVFGLVGSDNDTLLDLYAADGASLLTSNDDDPVDGGSGSRVEYEFTSSATVYARVKQRRPDVGGCDVVYYVMLSQAPVTPAPTQLPSATPIPPHPSTPMPPPTNTPRPTYTPVPPPSNTPRPTYTPVPPPSNTPRPTYTPVPPPSNTPRPTDTPAPACTASLGITNDDAQIYRSNNVCLAALGARGLNTGSCPLTACSIHETCWGTGAGLGDLAPGQAGGYRTTQSSKSCGSTTFTVCCTRPGGGQICASKSTTVVRRDGCP